MLKAIFQIHKPAALMLSALVVSFSVLAPAGATAAETFFSKPSLDDLMDGDVTVARMGQRGPAVNMSVISPANVRPGEPVRAGAVRQTAVTPEVYLTISLPW